MKIRTEEDVERVRETIGNQNAKACMQALADGAEVWVFKGEGEIERENELSEEEKKECKKILEKEGLGYAGWFRKPKKEKKLDSSQILLGCPSSNYDSHGNYRGGGGGGHESIH